MRATLVTVWLTATAACSESHPADAGPGSATDGPAPEICAPAAPPDPRFLRLAGTAEAIAYDGSAAGELREIVGIYLPDGRVDGGRALAVHPVSWPRDGLEVSESTLTGGRARVVLSGSYREQDFAIDGTFDAMTGALVALATRNLAHADTDVAWPVDAAMTLCPTSDGPPEPTLTASWELSPLPPSPLSTLHFAPTVPLALGLTARVETGGVVIAVASTVEQTLAVSPVAAFPPGAELVVRSEGTDVLGRALAGPPVVVEPLATTAVAADPSFDTEPAAGAVAGGTWVDGEIRAGSRYGNFDARAIVALRPAGASTAVVSVRAASLCPGPVRVGLVGPSGDARTAETSCGASGAVELVIGVPAGEVVHLVVDAVGFRRRPQWLPPPGGPEIWVEGVRFD